MAAGQLVFDLIARTDRFSRGMNTARKSMGSFVSSSVAGLARVATSLTGLTAAGTLGFAIKLAADAEQVQTSFEVMTGSAETAMKLVEDLRNMGANTPFQTKDLMDATKTLLNFGRTSETVLEDLDILSNAASGDSERLKSLALVFGQIAANGKLMGQDLLQLINAGFNPLLQISEKTGESMSSLRERMSKGEISFDDVRQAFVDATSEGGRFYQMNDRQSQTLLGRWSTLKDNVTNALMEIGIAISDEFDLTGILEKATEMVQTFKGEWKNDVVSAIRDAADAGKGLYEAFKFVADNVQVAIDKIKELKGYLPATNSDSPFNTFDSLFPGLTPFRMYAKNNESAAGVLKGLPTLGGPPERPAAKAPTVPFKEYGPEISKEMQKERSKLIAEGKAVEQSVMTPIEKFQAEIDRLTNLFEGGFIDKQTFDRAAQMAVDNLPKQKQPTNEVRSLEAKSSEAFDVLRANVSPQTKTQNEQLKVQKKSEQHLSKIVDELSKPRDTVEVRGFN